MSTLLEASGGGVDLSQLTNVERWLLGNLGAPKLTSVGSTIINTYYGRIKDPVTQYFPTRVWEFTNIYSITVTGLTEPSSLLGYSSIGFTIGGGGNEGRWSVTPGQTVTYTLTDVDRSPNIWGDGPGRDLQISEAGSGTGGGYAGWQIDSFTTMDGKVHTADNLNY